MEPPQYPTEKRKYLPLTCQRPTGCTLLWTLHWKTYIFDVTKAHCKPKYSVGSLGNVNFLLQDTWSWIYHWQVGPPERKRCTITCMPHFSYKMSGTLFMQVVQCSLAFINRPVSPFKFTCQFADQACIWGWHSMKLDTSFNRSWQLPYLGHCHIPAEFQNNFLFWPLFYIQKKLLTTGTAITHEFQ